MFKFLVPIVFLLLADGTQAGRKDEGTRAAAEKSGHKAPAGVATERKAGDDKAAGHKEGEKDGPKDGGKEAHKDAHKDDAGHGDGKKVASKGHGPGEKVAAPPAGVTAPAMHDELKEREGAKKAATERERLEALSTDLARARTALRDETVRLEGLMEKAKQSGGRPGGPAAPNGTSPAPGGAASAASGAAQPAAPGTAPPMPVGDPLAPSAYFRPVPPPPNFAVQVDVVSRAMKSMKPEQAAGIIGHLERGLAAEVLQRMKPADAGAILGFLKPEVGAALAAEIVSRPPIGKSKDKDPDKEKP